MADDLMFWRYEPVIDGKPYFMAIESALPTLEKSFGVTVIRPGVPMYGAEFMAATGWIGFSPEVRLAMRREKIAASDPAYKRAIAAADAAVDKEVAGTKRAEARLVADVLIAAEDVTRQPDPTRKAGD